MNRVILKRVKKKLDDSKGLVELLNEILWSYHTTLRFTARETPFTMVYTEDAMLPVEINMPSWIRSHFIQEVNDAGLKCTAYLIDEIRNVTHTHEFATNEIATRR